MRLWLFLWSQSHRQITSIFTSRFRWRWMRKEWNLWRECQVRKHDRFLHLLLPRRISRNTWCALFRWECFRILDQWNVCWQIYLWNRCDSCVCDFIFKLFTFLKVIFLHYKKILSINNFLDSCVSVTSRNKMNIVITHWSLFRVDVDECANSALNNCTGKGGRVCINTPGSFECRCDDGYEIKDDFCTGECKKWTDLYLNKIIQKWAEICKFWKRK